MASFTQITFLAAVGDRPEVWRHTVGPDTSHQHCRQHRLQHLHTCSPAGSAGERCDRGECSCGGDSRSCAGRQWRGPHTSTLSSPPSPPDCPRTPGLNPAKMYSNFFFPFLQNRESPSVVISSPLILFAGFPVINDISTFDIRQHYQH